MNDKDKEKITWIAIDLSQELIAKFKAQAPNDSPSQCMMALIRVLAATLIGWYPEEEGDYILDQLYYDMKKASRLFRQANECKKWNTDDHWSS